MIKREYPSRILITGGHEVGGVSSFAESLCEGFAALGISAEIVSPSRIFGRWRDLRDPSVLKILSTTAVFAAPFARRAICVAHGFPRPDVQGWMKALGVTASFKIAGWFAQLVAVSYYSAIHLRTIFNLRVDAVIHNPLNDAFFTERASGWEGRDSITFAGRLHPSKGLERILPAMLVVLEEHPELRAAIVGDGELRALVEAAARCNSRIELVGQVPPNEVRMWLRRTRVFISGCETEALGIAYLEALSQGCVVVMPACGGGVEIAPELIGSTIHLYSGEGSEPVARTLRRALAAVPAEISLAAYSSRAIAHAYLELDCCSNAHAAELAEAIL
jgi:glycosyltransferase involved in cell wall biosynthesis